MGGGGAGCAWPANYTLFKRGAALQIYIFHFYSKDFYSGEMKMLITHFVPNFVFN